MSGINIVVAIDARARGVAKVPIFGEYPTLKIRQIDVFSVAHSICYVPIESSCFYQINL